MNDVALLDATAQAELVRKKEVKPIELLQAAIERAERVNPRINAIVIPMYELAREAAYGKLPEGPLSGVPYLLKDLGAAYAGVRQTSGSVFLKDYVSPLDTTLTQRLKAAGLVIFGKTNTPEFGLLPTTEPRLFGPTRNPWNMERTSGGSSGGSAAAVAAGILPMAHANDGGGSIRIPASCCGLFGLKPTRARVPLGPLLGDIMNGLVCEHAVTRTVRDSAALLDTEAGPEPGDPYMAPPKERPYIEEVGRDPGSLRIAFSTTAPRGVEIHPDCIAAVKDAAALCEELGHKVIEAAPVIAGEQLLDAFITVWASGNAFTLASVAFATGKTLRQEDFEPLTWALYEQGKQTDAGAYLMAVLTLQMMSRSVAAFFQQFDLWLTPTLSQPPLPLGAFDPLPGDPLAGLRVAADFVPFTPIQNATGQPGMSVPLYWNGEGLPIGVHFAGRFGDEATLFRLAAQLEEARPWAGRRPPVSAV
jgi:amidase